jgi:hypothetical protein
MAESTQTSPLRIIQVGSDQVTIAGDDLIIETRQGMPDWEVREFNPVPVYFQHRKYLLVQKRRGEAPFAIRYLLTIWPSNVFSNNVRFHTYDEQTVAERDGAFRSEQVGKGVWFMLLPFYPLLGLLWSSVQIRLAYLGFVPRYLTGCSIGTVLFVFIPGILLSVVLVKIPAIVFALAFFIILVGLMDVLMRGHFYFRDEGWCGGFLEWFFPPVREVPAAIETKTPGFWASLEILLWNFVENAAGSKKKPEKARALNLPPILERELRVALRKLKPVRRRLRLAAACTAAVFLLSILAGKSAGRDLHHLLCAVGFYVVLTAPQRIAGLFSTERQEQTLGLLFISGLSATEVFLSKTISAVAIVFSDLISMTPLLALPFLMGGVSFQLFLATICCLPNLLLFAVAISLLGSVLSEDEGTAVLLTVVLGVLMVGFPLVIYLVQKSLSDGNPTLDWLLLCNPTYGPWLVFKKFSAGEASEFWRNYLITFFVSILCFTIAAFLLQRLWRQREEHGVLFRWRETWRSAVHGTVAWRKRLASTWLHKSPCAWLAARDRGPLTVAWMSFFGMILIWLLGWVLWPAKWLSTGNFFLTAILLNSGLRWIIHYSAAGIGFARRDGSYELLLTTPLKTGQIVDGQVAALRWRFRRLCRVALAVEIMMMLAGLCMREWTLSSLAVYLIVWGALLVWAWQQSWNFGRTALSMWAGLNSARPLLSVWRTTGFTSWVWIWILFNLRHGLAGLAGFPFGSYGELFVVSLIAIVIFLLFLRSFSEANVHRERLKAEFREIVREPIPDPRDSRFKQWNIRERFPWGWEMAQEQLHERLIRREST